MQYVDITAFINQQISLSNKNMGERMRLFLELKKVKSEPILGSRAFSVLSILESSQEVFQQVKEEYDITDEKVFTNSEFLKRFITKDYSKFYSAAVSLQNMVLMFPSEFASLFETEQEKIERELKSKEKKDSCKTMVVAKQYHTMQELEQDNQRPIYFDKKYDKTKYGLLDEYEKDMMRMEPDEFIRHLIQELIKKQRLSEEDAEYLAETLIDGHKKVINGQYAVVFTPEIKDQGQKMTYFVRKQDVWVLDNEIQQDILTDDPDMLCDLQQKCISVPGDVVTPTKCEDVTVDAISLQNEMLKDMTEGLNDLNEQKWKRGQRNIDKF
jgi:hypothetical protein